MPVEQAERAAEQVDARRDERRADAVVVEHQRLDQVVGVALVIRRVDDPMRADGGHDVVQVLVPAFDFPQDRVERMLKRAVERITLGGAQLVEVGADALASARAALAVSDDFLARQHGFGDVIAHGVLRNIARPSVPVRQDARASSALLTASANSNVLAVPPRSRVRTWRPTQLAMVLDGGDREAPQASRVQIFATDLDAAAIGVARTGRYPEGIAADMSDDRLRRFFVVEEPALSRQEGGARSSGLRGSRCAARPALHPHGSGVMPEPSDLPGARARSGACSRSSTTA